MTTRWLRVVCTVVSLLSLSSYAKRSGPAEVPPVVVGGVRFEAPHFDNPCGQTGGCVVASDAATGTQLWWVKVYTTVYDPSLEKDVQDVFITSLSTSAASLQATDEKGRTFTIDARSRVVRGPNCASVAGGPAFAWCALAALRLRRRRGAASSS